MAAAIGAGLPVEEASGNMVVDIGGGTSEIAILSLNGVVYSESVKIGGDKMDESITSWIRRNYGCVIGESSAEKIKYTIGCATPDSEKLEMSITGRNLAEGIPETFTINIVAEDPLTCVARGGGQALEIMDKYNIDLLSSE